MKNSKVKLIIIIGVLLLNCNYLLSNEIFWYQVGHTNYYGFLKQYPISCDILVNKNKIISSSASYIRIYDMKNNQLVDIYKPNIAKDIGCVSDDEKYFCSSYMEVIDIETGKYVKSLDSAGQIVFQLVQFSPDGNYIVGLSLNQFLYIYNYNTGKIESVLNKNDKIYEFSITKNNKLFFICNNGKLYNYDINYNKYEDSIIVSDYFKGYLSLSNSDSLIVLTNTEIYNNNISIYNIKKNKIEFEYNLENYTEEIISRAVLFKNDSCLAYCLNNQLFIMRITDKEILKTKECAIYPNYLKCSKDDKFILLFNYFTQYSNNMHVTSLIDYYDVTKDEIKSAVQNTGHIYNISFSNDSKYLYVFTNRSFIQKFDIFSKSRLWVSDEFVPQYQEYFEFYYPFKLSNTDKYIAVCAEGSDSNNILLFDTYNGKLLYEIKAHSDIITSLAFSQDDKYLASGGLDSVIKIWDIENKTIFKSINVKDQISLLNFKNDDEIYAIIGRLDGGIRSLNLYNIYSGEEIYIGYNSSGYGFYHYRYPQAISSNNKYLATNDWWDDFVVLDIKSSDWTIHYDTLDIFSLAFTPDEKYLATGIAEPYINIWDFINKKVAAKYEYNSFIRLPYQFSSDSTAPIMYCIAFSPDGRFVAGGNDDGSVIIWENTLINVEENQIQKGNIIIYPNPATDEFRLRFQTPTETTLQLSIFDLLGNCVISQALQSNEGINEKTINCERLPQGYYYVKINVKEHVQSIPLMIIK